MHSTCESNFLLEILSAINYIKVIKHNHRILALRFYYDIYSKGVFCPYNESFDYAILLLKYFKLSIINVAMLVIPWDNHGTCFVLSNY